MSERLRWQDYSREWPNAEYSRFVEAGGVHWHVQVGGDDSGASPTVILIHGTGASTHSWRDVLPRLTRHARVIAPDLPGHGFSSKPPLKCMSLPAIAGALEALYRTLNIRPHVLVGHSAGAAIALRQEIDEGVEPSLVVSLNGAIMPFTGIVGHLLYGPLARATARLPPLAPLFSWHVRSDRSVVTQLLGQTGSRLDAPGEHLYRVLAGNREHVQATLDMMSQWDLTCLERDLPEVRAPTVLVYGDRDHTVPPSQALDAQLLIPGSRTVCLRGLGHLAHEEAPDRVCTLLEELLAGLS